MLSWENIFDELNQRVKKETRRARDESSPETTKFNESQIESLLELLKDPEMFRFAIKAGVDFLKSYGAEFGKLLEAIRKATVESRIKSIKQYETEGNLTRAEAILLVLDTSVAREKALESLGVNLYGGSRQTKK